MPAFLANNNNNHPTTPNFTGAISNVAPSPRTPVQTHTATTANTPRTPNQAVNGTRTNTPRTPNNVATTMPRNAAFTDNSGNPARARATGSQHTPSAVAESPGIQAANDVTPDLTDALSSRRRSPPRIAYKSTSAARSERSPASLRRAREAIANVVSGGRGGPATGAGGGVVSGARSGVNATSNAPGPVMRRPPPAGPGSKSGLASVAAMLESDEMDSDQITALIAMLEKKKSEQASGQTHMRAALLHDFLNKARAEKQKTIERLTAEVAVLDSDLKTVEASRALAAGSPEISQTLRTKRRRVEKNYEPLKNNYFANVAVAQGVERRAALKQFTDDIMKVTQYSRFRCRASLLHVARHNGSPSNIVSSIEFDRESRLVATAGVTKRIKIFEFPADANVAEGGVHYPVKEIPARAKLSWVCWNPYIRQQLVSSDYEGIVTLWDVNRSTLLNEYEEHDKRVWSVDFCTKDPRVFASGSDDGRVKIWTTAQPNSVVTIGNGCANVCSVKFQPDSTYMLAYGSADHSVHYYDVRYTAQALRVFEGHERTVSYVKFMGQDEMVSACVDSTIKLWDLKEMKLTRTYRGHLNDKNFVGLSVTDEFIACGSEQNSIYAYYKTVPEPVAKYRFPGADLVTGVETNEDDESFVSSVCWCPKNPRILVGANSVGIIKVLQLSEDDDEEEVEQPSGEDKSEVVDSSCEE